MICGSAASDIAGAETNNSGDVFQTDLATFVTRKASTRPSGIETTPRRKRPDPSCTRRRR